MSRSRSRSTITSKDISRKTCRPTSTSTSTSRNPSMNPRRSTRSNTPRPDEPLIRPDQTRTHGQTKPLDLPLPKPFMARHQHLHNLSTDHHPLRYPIQHPPRLFVLEIPDLHHARAMPERRVASASQHVPQIVVELLFLAGDPRPGGNVDAGGRVAAETEHSFVGDFGDEVRDE